MKWVKSFRRWTVRSLRVLILGAALVGPASMAIAQTPGATAAKLPSPNFARSLSFHLPLKIEADQRLNLKEVQLWTKTPTTNWKLQETSPPYVDQFICTVPHDGEYWYSLRMVDRAGRGSPADVTTEPPLQRVVVDSTAPVIQVQGCNGADGGYCLRCTVDDANPDHTTLKVVCKTPTGDIALEAVPNQPNLFRVNRAEFMKHLVIVSAADMAKNTSAKEVNVPDLLASTLNATPKTPSPAAPITLTTARPDAGSATSLPAPRTDSPPNLPKPELPRQTKTVETPSKTAPAAPAIPDRIELPTPPALGSLNMSSASSPPATHETPTKLPTGAETQPRSSAPLQLINTTHASVEYRIDQVGPSGIGKVEIYLTADDGQTWRRHCENSSKRSPADINLPGDGVFGIRIVTTNGNGFGGRAPVRGDAPQCIIEVDTTSPFVQLRSAELLPSTGQVEIRWTATDKNLSPTPINLFYRVQAEGPWLVLARDLKNDGVHRWDFPRDVSSQFFFKVEVADQAGNVAQDLTRQAVNIDTTEPRAVVVGVTGSGARP